MKGRLFFPLVLFVILLSYCGLALDDNCTSLDHKGCDGNYVYWFDSCGNKENYVYACNWNEECVNGECIPLCGNGVCEEDKGETCSNCKDCSCRSYERCSWGQCKTYCGNGRCDTDENCWKCNLDCSCGNDERCDYPGVCRTYCGNGKCDSDENCQICYDCACESNQDCRPSSPNADSRGCVDRCGNGIIDWGENCQSCPEDASCSDGTYCYNGNCVECFKDSHCESRENPTGQFICSSDFRSTLEKIIKTEGVCRNNHCTGEKVETTRQASFCGDKLCQDGECGCKEGFVACLKSGKCEKRSALDDGQSCYCYSQCKSNYCSPQGKCVKAINAPLTVSKKIVKVRETIKVTISADNALQEDIPTKITLNTDSGVLMSGVIGGADCSGNQCTGGETIIPSKGRVSITVDLTPQSYGQHILTATITPTIGGMQYPKEEEITLTVINPGDGVCSEGENSQNACSDCGCPEAKSIYEYVCKEDQSCKRSVKWHYYFIFIAIVIVVGFSIYYIPKVRSYYHKKSIVLAKKREEKERKEFEERKRIVAALYKIKNNIKIDNPLPIEKVISKARLQNADPEKVHEEYIEMLERMRKVRSLSGAKKKEAEKILKKPIRQLAQRFCTGCGAPLRDGAKFCTKCGRAVRK